MKLNYSMFIRALNAASIMAIKDVARPIIENMYIDIKKDKIIIEALNHYSVVRIVFEDVRSNFEIRFLLSPDLLKRLPKEKDVIDEEIEITQNQIKWTTKPFLIEQNIEAEKENRWPNINYLFEKAFSTTNMLTIGIDKLSTVIKSAKEFKTDKENFHFKIYMPAEQIKPLLLEFRPFEGILCEYVILPIRPKNK